MVLYMVRLYGGCSQKALSRRNIWIGNKYITFGNRNHWKCKLHVQIVVISMPILVRFYRFADFPAYLRLSANFILPREHCSVVYLCLALRRFQHSFRRLGCWIKRRRLAILELGSQLVASPVSSPETTHFS